MEQVRGSTTVPGLRSSENRDISSNELAAAELPSMNTETNYGEEQLGEQVSGSGDQQEGKKLRLSNKQSILSLNQAYR